MILSFFIVYNKRIYLHCCEHRAPTTAMPSQVVHTANCKKWWYSQAKWQIVSTPIATNLESPMHHKMKAMFVTKVITMINPCTNGQPWWGRKVAMMSHSTHNWCLNVQMTSGTSLVQPLIYVVLVTQEQMPNMNPLQWLMLLCHWMRLNTNATWRSGWPWLPQ